MEILRLVIITSRKKQKQKQNNWVPYEIATFVEGTVKISNKKENMQKKNKFKKKKGRRRRETKELIFMRKTEKIIIGCKISFP